MLIHPKLMFYCLKDVFLANKSYVKTTEKRGKKVPPDVHWHVEAEARHLKIRPRCHTSHQDLRHTGVWLKGSVLFGSNNMLNSCNLFPYIPVFLKDVKDG